MFVQRRRIWKHDNEAEGEMLGSNQSWRSVEVKTRPRLGKLAMNIYYIPTFYDGNRAYPKLKVWESIAYYSVIHFSDLSWCSRKWKRWRNSATCVQRQVERQNIKSSWICSSANYFMLFRNRDLYHSLRLMVNGRTLREIMWGGFQFE